MASTPTRQLCAFWVIFGTAAGCSDQVATNVEEDGELKSDNGLMAINGLNVANGLMAINGLNVANGLMALNGLASYTGLMSTPQGRTTVSYLVKCALPAGRSIRKQDQAGNWVTFQGELGFGAGWETGACDKTCQEGISACMMARINTAGVHIPLWLVSPAPSVGWGRSSYYPNQEGTFFGNIFKPNPATGKIDAFFCNGPGFAQSTVPGRLGAYQNNAPYTNPFGTNAACAGNCIAASSPNQNDGYKSCKGYNTPVTVWREPAPVFELAKTYRMCAQHSGRCVTIEGASRSDGARTVQWGFNSGDNQKFKITSLGDGFYSFCNKSSGKCLDTNPPGGGDGSTVYQWAYDGSDSQRWAISSVGDGWFSIMVKEASRSLDVFGASHSDGAKIGQYAYNGAQNQTFRLDYAP